MEFKLSYFRQDGKLRAVGRVEMATGSTDYDSVLEYIVFRSRLQYGLPGIAGLADCYHILIEAAGLEPRLVPARRLNHLDSIRPALDSVMNTPGVANDD